MRYFDPKITVLFIVILLNCISCKRKEAIFYNEKVGITTQKINKPEFQKIIDSANLKGALLIYDLNTSTFYSNDFKWSAEGKLPASTFKIPNSIIALETGVVSDDTSILKWNGEKRAQDIWEQDLSLKKAFHVSCVPCYQEIAKKIGVQKMKNYLSKFNYGAIKVDSISLQNFWLRGKSKISPFEQLDFLKRFYTNKLPITQRSYQIMKNLMIIESNAHFTISGKTGWSIINNIHNGWFVGYIETNQNVYFFATNISPNQEFDMKKFPVIRKEVTYKALKHMRIMK